MLAKASIHRLMGACVAIIGPSPPWMLAFASMTNDRRALLTQFRTFRVQASAST